MGLYFKRSVGFGPLRFNLSGSGVGASVGVPGFRIGVNARGQSYLHAGRYGAYYRTNLSPPQDHVPSTPTTEVIAPAGRTHGAMVQHGSVHSSVRQDELTAAITEAVQHSSYVPLASIFLIGSIAAFVYVVANGHADVATVGLALLSLLAIGAGVLMFMAAWQRDQRARIELKYDLDEDARNQWDSFCRVIATLSSAGVKLQRGTAQVYDPKYHSGAGQLVDTSSLRVIPAYRLHGIICGVKTPVIEPVKGTKYVFLPDRIVCIRDKRLSRMEYGELRFERGTTSIIEDHAPAGATIVGHSWRYTNKSGGPDRRFKDNYQLPIVEYALVRLTTTGGMDHAILFVLEPAAAAFVESLSAMASWEASYDRMIPAPTALLTPAISRHLTDNSTADLAEGKLPSVRQSEARSSLDTGDPFDSVLDSVCCVMFADGSCSTSERETIVAILAKLKAPWTERQIVDRMARRWQDVKSRGFDAVLTETRAAIGCIRTEQQQTVLRKCLQEVAKADGRVANREKAVYQRLLESLPPITASDPVLSEQAE